MVGTQRSRVCWVHRGAGYGGYTEEQGMMGAQSGVITYYAIHVHIYTHKFITIRCRKIPRRIYTCTYIQTMYIHVFFNL